MIPIDPITALAAVQKAVKMVKMASQTANDVAQLGPLLGNYFDAKATATKAARQAKKKGGSNLGAAMQIEMALKAQADFEREIQGLFFSSNNMDIWHQIKKREAEMNAEDKAEAEREKIAEIRAKRRQQEFRELAVGIVICVVILSSAGWMLVRFLTNCSEGACGL
jgi:putative ubiquitin-RnfH superfamily antitoxin RatB of RatAB toxin-antitoxin module